MSENWFKSGIVFGSLLIGAAACGSSTSASNTNNATGDGTTNVAEAHAKKIGPQSAVVHTHPSQGGERRNIEGANAIMISMDEGAMFHITDRELTPNGVYTLWAIIINKPENCATSPCTAKDVIGNDAVVESEVMWAGSGVAKEDGSITLTGWVPANVTGNADYGKDWYGRGLTNPTGAEVHLSVNAHGPVIAGREAKMLTSYREGCTDESIPGIFPDTAKADGTAGEGKCALVHAAAFLQHTDAAH